ncbi:MAG: hypothetical protein HY554_14410 [Elusimicrobia bacterium]|nr:hypothetical protein [Elusimicrobiota bacterium]
MGGWVAAAAETARCFTCRLLEVRQGLRGDWTCWCPERRADLGQFVMGRIRCGAHQPRRPGESPAWRTV